MGTVDAARAVKALTDAAAARGAVIRLETEALRVVPGSDRGEATCLYTSSANEDFILHRVGRLIVCSPCSGHGAKFAPLVGELAADLTQPRVAEALPSRFRLAAHGVPGRGPENRF